MNTIIYNIIKGAKFINKLIVHTDILSDNIEKIMSNFKNKDFIYVAKANAYGIGINAVVPTVLKFTRNIMVANFEEALEISRKFNGANVSTLLPSTIKETTDSIKMGVGVTISNETELNETVTLAKSVNIIPKIQIKINSGMNRFGIDNQNEFENLLNICRQNKIVNPRVYTHLASSDFVFSRKQIEKFNDVLCKSKIYSHVSLNDYTTFSKAVGFNAVRSGITVLGAEENLLQTKQCFELQSEILSIRDVEKGEYVGYNFGFCADKKTTFAVVGIGYADISIRNLSNCGKVLVNQKKCDIIGYICMDVMFVDVTNVKCKKGDIVSVIGFDSENSIRKIAKTLNTITYEVMTSISSRVKRM